MRFWIYRIAVCLALPLVLLRFRRRAKAEPEYGQRWSERFGHVPFEQTQQRIWLHAASMGEVVAAIPLIAGLIEKYSDQRILVTTMTPTGSAKVQESFGERVDHCYVPLDVSHFVQRFLAAAKPSILILMETELWPNLIRCSAQKNIPVVVASARLTDSSMRGYAKFPGAAVMRETLGRVACIAAQSEMDAERFRSLAANPTSVKVLGNIKFDLQIDPQAIEQAEALRADLQERFVWVAASTHDGEERIALDAHLRLLNQCPGALLVIAARHPDRFEQVVAVAQSSGLSVGRFSESPDIANLNVLVIDAMGQLMPWFGAAQVALIGGSFVPIGGHNVLEPAAAGCAVLIGPHHHEFLDICERMSAAGGLLVVPSPEVLAERVAALENDRKLLGNVAESAQKFVTENQGALQQNLAMIAELLPRSAGTER